jgi:hypothetical protein
MRKLLLVLVVLLISGCAMVQADRIKTADEQGKFYAGMPFNEVVNIVGHQPGAAADIYKVTNENGAVYKEWQVGGKSYTGFGELYRYYEFKFKDDKLVSWSWHK